MRQRPILAFAVPLLIGAAQPAAAPEACDAARENGVHIAPLPIVDVARDPIPIADHMPVAHEVVQIATKGWLLGSALRVPGPERLVYPAGTPLDPDHARAPGELCLPLARPPFGLIPDPERRGPGAYVQPCLADMDGDGAYERIDIFAGDSAMHVPTRRPIRSETLAVPQSLIADPLGLATSRRYVHREVTAYVDGPVAAGTIVRLRIAHAFQDQDRYDPAGAPASSFVAGADGTSVYRLVPGPPHPVSMTGNGYYGAANDPDATIVIADGAEVMAGGLKFRIDQYSHGWTIQPQAYRFPPWVHYDCDGRRVELGGPR